MIVDSSSRQRALVLAGLVLLALYLPPIAVVWAGVAGTRAARRGQAKLGMAYALVALLGLVVIATYGAQRLIQPA